MVTYNLGNLADWFTAIGTVGTLIFTIYLTTRESRVKGKVIVRVNRGKYIKNGETMPDIEICLYNMRTRPIQIKAHGVYIHNLFHKIPVYFNKNDDGSVIETIEMGKVFLDNLKSEDIKNIAKCLGADNIFTLGYYAYFECYDGKIFIKKIDI